MAKCTVATGRYRADNIYVLRIQCAVSYQLIGEGRKGASRAKSGTETKRRGRESSRAEARVRVTVAIALKPSVHTTRVRCMYDPAIQPPRAPLIYIGSDLPILCITRAWIVISLRPSEVQSSGMAVASLCLVPRYTVLSVVPGPLYSADGNRRGDPRSIFPQNMEPRLHGSGGLLDRSHFGLDCFFHGGFSSRIRDEVLSGPICADYCDSFNDGAIRFDAYLFFGSKAS